MDISKFVYKNQYQDIFSKEFYDKSLLKSKYKPFLFLNLDNLDEKSLFHDPLELFIDKNLKKLDSINIDDVEYVFFSTRMILENYIYFLRDITLKVKSFSKKYKFFKVDFNFVYGFMDCNFENLQNIKILIIQKTVFLDVLKSKEIDWLIDFLKNNEDEILLLNYKTPYDDNKITNIDLYKLSIVMNDKIENSSFDEVLLKPYIANFYKYNFKMYDNKKLFLNKNFIN